MRKTCKNGMIMPRHFREDGTCLCDDKAEQAMMIRDLGFSRQHFKKFKSAKFLIERLIEAVQDFDGDVGRGGNWEYSRHLPSIAQAKRELREALAMRVKP